MISKDKEAIRHLGIDKNTLSGYRLSRLLEQKYQLIKDLGIFTVT